MTSFLSHYKLIKIYLTGAKAREVRLENIQIQFFLIAPCSDSLNWMRMPINFDLLAYLFFFLVYVCPWFIIQLTTKIMEGKNFL